MNQTNRESQQANRKEACDTSSTRDSAQSCIQGAAGISTSSRRISPLDEALRLTRGARQSSYGHPMENFSQTGALWTSLLNLPPGTIDAQKVAMMMVLLKLSRQTNRHNPDNLVDAAGYINCLDMVYERLELRSAQAETCGGSLGLGSDHGGRTAFLNPVHDMGVPVTGGCVRG